MKEKNEIESKLTIYYDEPFWAGVFERIDNGKLSVCKVTFGAEPTDAQVREFVLANYRRLRFSVPVKAEQKQKADNPKRRQRNARKQMESSGIGTKSQRLCKSNMRKTRPSTGSSPVSKEKPKNSGSSSSNSKSAKKSTEVINDIRKYSCRRF